MPQIKSIDWYLMAAEASEIPPVIVINKTDSIDEQSRPFFDTVEEKYPSLGYQVLRVSTHTGEGLAALAVYLSQYNSAFVGQSGVGKSSLANALLTGINLRVGALSELTYGRHM